MKSLKNILAVLLCLTIVMALCITGFAAPETDGIDAEFMYKLYITDMLHNDMITSGKSRDELLQKRADELGLSDIRAYEIELECGLHPVIYTKDELPLPSATITEPTELTTAPSTTAESTEVTTTPAITNPVTNATEPTEVPTTPATDDQSGTNRYYFYKPGFWLDNKYSDTVGIYWWDATDAPEAWPGYEAKESEVKDVYYYDVPKDVTKIIWNNFVDGGSDNEAEIYYCAYQTENICTEFFFPDECVIYPNGVESFDGMIFVTHPIILTSDYNGKVTNYGNWYYYYGNGEYGITPEKGDKFYTGSFQVDIPSTADYEDISIILGDINNDRKLSIKDATLIQKYLAQIENFDNVEIYLSDYNEDGAINIKDATTIQKKLANII